MSDLRIGTSGWSYPEGPGAWNGVFYPARRTRGRSARGGDLAFYAEHFATVEVNSSFYRVPDPAVTAKWAGQTPADFDFSVKLFQQFTHPAMYLKAAGRHAGEEDSPIPSVTRRDVDLFKAALDPLADAGKLGALLAQFPPAFREGEDSREYLAWLLEAFSGYALAVELRHRSWSDRAAEVIALLGGHGAAWVQIDEPKFRFSIRQTFAPNVPGLYYLRLHGRNAAKWWTHDHPDERYDYLYSPAEISGFADAIARVRGAVRRIYVYMNNHFAGKAVANAAALRHALGQPVPGEYSDEMLERYPFLGPYATRAGAKPLLDRAAKSGSGGETGRSRPPRPRRTAAGDAEPQEG
ncbi:MAG TPA: DUF72 domain-containing protein [Vicinamibacterales bacterium]|mgnify:CR=1 FL=1|nr:DUF72 domain-containing protein [Vicinamibacterales bacterium]HOQ59890.1 DUF72 domain-containing protein [Vicinamibacterales bacterium]HPK71513.1 DUF72 domain-containing protein [Vicinamibacterales bacterium]